MAPPGLVMRINAQIGRKTGRQSAKSASRAMQRSKTVLSIDAAIMTSAAADARVCDSSRLDNPYPIFYKPRLFCPLIRARARIAQLVEQGTENPYTLSRP